MHASTCPVPTCPRRLGAAGVLPFLGLAILTWVPGSHHELAVQGLLAYGAVILSFVGALHWGVAMCATPVSGPHQCRLYVGSVVPALLAWGALLLPPGWAVALLLIGLWAHYAQDRRIVRIRALPPWYLPLRLTLTGLASLALILAWPRMI
jgi:hypothetical protein